MTIGTCTRIVSERNSILPSWSAVWIGTELGRFPLAPLGGVKLVLRLGDGVGVVVCPPRHRRRHDLGPERREPAAEKNRAGARANGEWSWNLHARVRKRF